MLIRQKLGTYIISSTIVAAVAVYLLTVNVVQGLIANLINDQQQTVIKSLTKDVLVFDKALQSLEQQWSQELELSLVQAAQEYLKLHSKNEVPDNAERLTNLRDKYHFSDLHIINKNLSVVASTEPSEVGLDMTKFSTEYTDYLNRLMNNNTFSTERISLSDVTGRLKKYAYFSPTGSDLLINADIDVQTRVNMGDSNLLTQYVVNQYIEQLLDQHSVVDDMDLMLLSASNQLSFFSQERNIDPEIAQQLYQNDKVAMPLKNQVYKNVSFDSYEKLGFKAYLFISFNDNLQKTISRKIQLIVGGICLLVSVIAIILLHYGMHRLFLNRLSDLVKQISAKQVTDGRNIQIAGDDELSAVSQAINASMMRIEQQLQINESLKVMTHLDGLTGVANRRAMDQHLLSEWSQANRDSSDLSLLMIDVDFFKQFNDFYGHAKGDDCLVSVAQSIAKSLQRPNDFVARYGGEEFLCILPNTDKAGAEIMAERLHSAIASLEIEHQTSEIADRLTISIGCYTVNGSQNKTTQELLARVDTLLYESKRHGRNTTTFV